MTDKPLFNLDAKGRWRLSYDRQQWVVQRRTKKARVGHTEGGSIADSGWRGVSFIGSEKRVLRRVLREKAVILIVEAQARLDALPETFRDFLAAIDSPRPDDARSCATRPSDTPSTRETEKALLRAFSPLARRSRRDGVADLKSV